MKQPLIKSKTFCIIGAGAIGIDLGALLIRSGYEVAFIARGETLDRLRRRGILYTPADGTEISISPTSYQVTDSTRDISSRDYVFLTVKSDALLEVAEQVPPLLHEGTLVITATNGIPPWYSCGRGISIEKHLRNTNVRDRFLHYVDQKHILGMVVGRNATNISPGRVRCNAVGSYIIGELDHSISARCEYLKGLLSAAGFDVRVSDNIHRNIWLKLLINITVNPLSVLTALPIGQMFDNEKVRIEARAIMEEVHSLGSKLGVVKPGDFDAERIFESFRRKRRMQYTSMYQDYMKGRPLELDRIIEVVLMLAGLETVNVPTPALQAMYGRLLKKIESDAPKRG